MDKLTGIGIAAAVATAAIGGTYYIGPDPDGPGSIPPLLVDGSPEEVLGKIRLMTAQEFLQHQNGNADEIALLSSWTSAPNNGEVVTTLSFASDRVLVLRAQARPAEGGKTELDILAELPESRFSTQPALHPYDRKALEVFADLLATDYVSSRLTGQRMASNREMERMAVAATGFDDRQMRALGDRLQQAMLAAYGQDVAEIGDSRASNPSDWGDGRMGSDWGSGPDYAGVAADQAAEAAEQAANEAQESAAGY